MMNQQRMQYYRHPRVRISAYIPEGSHRVLDVGCGAGNFGAHLKNVGKAGEIFGIELFPKAADEARIHLDRVVCFDVDSPDFSTIRGELGSEPFDYIVFADVLEHTKDPWQVLARFREFLTPEGKIVVSIPNVRHWSVWLPLVLRGRWDYQDEGIMDRTHLRFFTKATACELITTAGFRTERVEPLIGGRSRTLAKLTGGMLDGLLAIQWVFVGGKSV